MPISCTIDLWSWSLDEPPETGVIPSKTLSEDELARASRFVFERDRQRFICGRHKLRDILATYIGSTPQALRFKYTASEKPEIDPQWQQNAPYFNLSHSGPLAMLAVSADTELGVDIEQLRPIEPNVAEQFFSACEQDALARLEGENWINGFYRLWTLKEAFLKAKGEGLLVGLDSFDIAFSADQPAHLLHLEGDSSAPDNWTLHSFTPAAGFVGALAVPIGNAELKLNIRQQT